MPSFDPKTLAECTGGRWSSHPRGVLTGFAVDSRRLHPGQVFVALKTAKRDGHDYLGEALKAGAVAAVVSRVVPGVSLAQLVVVDPLSALQRVALEHRRNFHGTVIGITGSAGKTSTKELLSLMLGGDAAGTLATEGNLNNHIGVPLTLLRLDPERHTFAVVEAGISAPGEMGVLAGMIRPDVAIVTLVGPAHLEELGGIDGVAREKAVLPGSVGSGGMGIFPRSCEEFEAFRELRHPNCLVLDPVAKLGSAAAPGRVPFAVRQSSTGTTVGVAMGGGPREFTLRRVTDGMAQNVAVALVAALGAGIHPEKIQERLRTWLPSPLRGEWRTSQGRRIYLDCYNANPASMADALAIFNDLAPRGEPRLLLLGCMEELGREARRYHVELGRSIGLRVGDQLVAIGGMADAIRDGALEAGAGADQIMTSLAVGPLAERLSAFRGSIFVKGSRLHQLETAFAGPVYAESSHA